MAGFGRRADLPRIPRRRSAPLPFCATILPQLARLAPASGKAALAKCSCTKRIAEQVMQLKSKELDWGELVINCLGVLVLLSVAVAWGPG